MAKTPFLRTAYNYDMNKAGDESGLQCPEPTLTKQSFQEECDINTIVRNFGLTGQLPANLRAQPPLQGDFHTITDFHSAMNMVTRAQQAFDQLPADLRSRFGNDPANFLEFVYDPENRQEAERLGLVKAPEPIATPAAPAAAPTPPAAPAGTPPKPPSA